MEAILKRPISNRSRAVLQQLKLKGPMTADELSRELAITAMGVRRHLAALERDGLVRHRPQRRRAGRPSHVYSLTERGDELFPRTYPQWANGLLDAIRALDGEEGLEKVLEVRTERLEAQYRARLAGKALEERVKELARIRAEEGYMADWEARDEDTFLLREHNCAICLIARRFPQACRYELALFQRALDDAEAEVTREEHIVGGDRMCTYVIRRASSPRS